MADNKIEYYCKLRGLSYPQLAKLAGVSTFSVQEWAIDRHQPRVFNAICLAQALGTTVEELFSP